MKEDEHCRKGGRERRTINIEDTERHRRSK